MNKNTIIPKDIKEKRTKIEKYVLEKISQIDPSGTNTTRYKEFFSKLSDDEFHEYMLSIKHGTQQIYIYAPNMANALTLDNLVKLTDEFGVEIFERIWFKDYNTGVQYLTPEKYMILTLPIRRARQLLAKKRSLPESDKTIDYLSGQVTKPDKAAALSQIEAQFLISKNLHNTVRELVKYRGGDIHAYSELKQALMEEGNAVLSPTTSIARSAVMLQVWFKAIHLDLNVV
jgi:hypothetical protein